MHVKISRSDFASLTPDARGIWMARGAEVVPDGQENATFGTPPAPSARSAGNVMKRAAWDQMDPTRQREFVNGGGRVVD